MIEKIFSRTAAKVAVLCCSLLLLSLFFYHRGPGAQAAEENSPAVHGPKIMVLNYHKIEDRLNSLCIPPRDFEAQLQYLQEKGYHTISPDELLQALQGSGTLPDKPVLITFDDGYSDNYHRAFPLLKKYHMKATIFVVTSFLDKNVYGYLTWQQAREMSDSGLISIQSHTHNHPSLTELNDEQRRFELAQSKKEIEEKLGKECDFVAYPTGTYDLHIASLVREAGYRGAFTIRYGNVDMESNLYALERMPIFHTSNTMRSFYDRMQYVPSFQEFGWEKN